VDYSYDGLRKEAADRAWKLVTPPKGHAQAKAFYVMEMELGVTVNQDGIELNLLCGSGQQPSLHAADRRLAPRKFFSFSRQRWE